MPSPLSRSVVALALAVCAIAPDLYAKCAPKKIMRIVTRFDAPGVPADGFGRRPKTLYRLGETYGRMEEELNPETGLHLLIVVNGADIWMLNRADGSGQHAVDPGPTIGFRAPVAGTLISPYWDNFELGCEVPFMEAVKASKTAGESEGSTLYRHEAEGVTATLLVDRRGVPQRVTVTTEDGTSSFVYDAWEQLDSDDPAMFARPEGTFTEASPQEQEPR